MVIVCRDDTIGVKAYCAIADLWIALDCRSRMTEMMLDE
jgi:hypothetical protein